MDDNINSKNRSKNESNVITFEEAIRQISKSPKLTAEVILEMLIKVSTTLYTVERMEGGIDRQDEYVAKNLAMLVIFQGLAIVKLAKKEDVDREVATLLAHYYEMAFNNEWSFSNGEQVH